MHPIFIGSIKKGKLVLSNPERFDNYLYSLNDKEVQIVIKPFGKNRSLPQNKFMWGVCYQLISEATGYTREEIHDSMRMMFLRDESREIPTLKSTTSLTTVEMNEYWAKIQQFAAEKLGLIIPDPNQVEV